MKKAKVKLRGLTPVTFGRFHNTEKLSKELGDAYEKRTWRDKAHFNEQGAVIIPSYMVANCIREAAKYLSMQVPGKGKSTYTKHFDSGIFITHDIDTGVKKSDLIDHWAHVPSDGQRGGTKRVLKCFPKILSWAGEIEILISDDILTADVVNNVIAQAGNLIGIGTWRPRNRGQHGKFEVVNFKWEE